MSRRQPLVVGIGNSLMADDGAGPYTVSLLEGRLPADQLRVLATPGTTLLSFIHDRSRVIVVDAARFGGAAGDVRRVAAQDMPRQGTTGSPLSLHDSGVLSVWDTAVSLDMAPQELVFYCVQAAFVGPRETLSPAVEQGCRRAADMIAQELSHA